MSQPRRREARPIKPPVQMFGPGMRPTDYDFSPHVISADDPLDPASLQGGASDPKGLSVLEDARLTPSTEDGSIPEPPDLTVPVDEGPPQENLESPGTITETTTTTTDLRHPSSTSEPKTSLGSDVPPVPIPPSSPTPTSSTQSARK